MQKINEKNDATRAKHYMFGKDSQNYEFTPETEELLNMGYGIMTDLFMK